MSNRLLEDSKIVIKPKEACKDNINWKEEFNSSIIYRETDDLRVLYRIDNFWNGSKDFIEEEMAGRHGLM